MLGLILTILKTGGIILGILLAVVLILLFLILFVPVRYDLCGENEAERELSAKGKVHWLFHIVTFEIGYEEAELKQIVRVFGVPVWKN